MSKDMSKKKQPSAARRPAPEKKTNLWIIALAGAFVILIALAAIFLRPSAATSSGLPAEISVAAAKEKYDSGVFVLDVRQPEEWNQGHIPNTTLIPLGELNNRLNELPKDAPIVVVCRSGNRSAQARDLLLQAGFSAVTSMAGGVNQWSASGYPIITGP